MKTLFAILALLWTVNAHSAQISVSVNETTINVGDEVVLSFSGIFDFADDFQGYQLSLPYDANAFSFDINNASSQFDVAGFTSNSDNGTSLSSLGLSFTGALTGTVNIFTLSLNALQSGVFSFDTSGLLLSDGSGNIIVPTSSTSATLTVAEVSEPAMVVRILMGAAFVVRRRVK